MLVHQLWAQVRPLHRRAAAAAAAAVVVVVVVGVVMAATTLNAFCCRVDPAFLVEELQVSHVDVRGHGSQQWTRTAVTVVQMTRPTTRSATKMTTATTTTTVSVLVTTMMTMAVVGDHARSSHILQHRHRLAPVP